MRKVGSTFWTFFLSNLEIAHARKNSPGQCLETEAQWKRQTRRMIASTVNGTTMKANGYAPVNGLKMYYEMEGTGDPLVCIPPAFGYAGLKRYPALIESHTVVTVDLQGHGRTADIPERPLSIERYAEDVASLLKYLGIAKADLFGESYGGNAVVMIAGRYTELLG